jgi:hypothetical protein
MAVYKNSRYYEGDAQQIKNKTTGRYNWTVYRGFPESKRISYIDYTWVDGDRLDYLASVYLSDARRWWEIMDINPELVDPFAISPGTIIRVPRS